MGVVTCPARRGGASGCGRRLDGIGQRQGHPRPQRLRRVEPAAVRFHQFLPPAGAAEVPGGQPAERVAGGDGDGPGGRVAGPRAEAGGQFGQVRRADVDPHRVVGVAGLGGRQRLGRDRSEGRDVEPGPWSRFAVAVEGVEVEPGEDPGVGGVAVEGLGDVGQGLAGLDVVDELRRRGGRIKRNGSGLGRDRRGAGDVPRGGGVGPAGRRRIIRGGGVDGGGVGADRRGGLLKARVVRRLPGEGVLAEDARLSSPGKPGHALARLVPGLHQVRQDDPHQEDQRQPQEQPDLGFACHVAVRPCGERGRRP